jgi:hypothetical protein
MFNATFGNISVISWLSVLLVEVTGENHQPVATPWQVLLHKVVSSTPRYERGSKLQSIFLLPVIFKVFEMLLPDGLSDVLESGAFPCS